MNLQDNQVIAYHYSSIKFEEFDNAKCDGFWFTSIAPTDTEMLNEIGAAGSKFCAKCILTIDDSEFNGVNSDVEQFLLDNNADSIINKYDGFVDYALADNTRIQILEWIQL